MTTATHSLDTSSGSTTVAELLARNGARTGEPPHRRSAPEPAGHGNLNGTLPALAPVEREAPKQYRYDETTVTALLAAQPAGPTPTAAGSKRTGRKLAGLAFAGAVLVGGWALASAQAQPADGPTSADPLPAKAPDAPLVIANAATLQAIGAQSAALAGSGAPSATAEIPATAEKAPDQGSFSGTLPTTTKAKAPAAKTTQPARQAQQAQPAPNWQSYYYDYARYANAKNSHPGGDNSKHGNGGRHGKGH
ncbi:MAG TPA: hypothetical protein VHC18_09445 [Amycolatopsis sp.]|nr:hypothetical protein [Amycolatopsis sp.]